MELLLRVEALGVVVNVFTLGHELKGEGRAGDDFAGGPAGGADDGAAFEAEAVEFAAGGGAPDLLEGLDHALGRARDHREF